MKIVSKVFGKIKNYVFTDEFDKKYETANTKLIFVLFCFSGGFCFNKDVRKNFRKFWIILNVFSFLFVNASCLFYIFNPPKTDFYALLLPAPVISGILTQCGIYLWIYLNRDLFQKLLEFFDDKDSQLTKSLLLPNVRQKYAALCSMQSKKFDGEMIAVLTCSVFIITMIWDVDKILDYENYFVNIYPIYTPYAKPFCLRIIFRIVQNTTILSEMIAMKAFPLMIFQTVVTLYNRFELLGLFLRDTSYSVYLRIDEVYNLETAMDEGRIRSSLSKIQETQIRKALALNDLFSTMMLVIKEHQKLYSIATMYGHKIESIFSALYLHVFLTAVIIEFIIPLVVEKGSALYIIVFIFALITVVGNWFIFCFIGQLFNNMNGIISTEIYCSPWYHLEPKDRKLILTFLTILQRPITLFACSIYPVICPSFPDTMNDIYSQMQILRTLQLNRIKHS